MRALITTALILSLSACRTDPDKPDTDTIIPIDDTSVPQDADGDGYDEDVDCDDNDASIHPDADEVCDGVDNDCDGEIDNDPVDASTWYMDADADGWGDADLGLAACDAPSGYVELEGDCDDTDPETYPDAPERCDGADNDCDGEIDEDLNEIWYADGDGDGFGNAERELDSCDPGEGWVADNTDCDDSDSTVNPAAEEVCNDIDDDCDGEIDEELETTWYADADGDGYGDEAVAILDCEPGSGWVEIAEDCDDANSSIHPDATEICDALDNDCDGLIDDEDDSVTDTTTWYTDVDGDGYGDDASTVTACVQPSGTAAYGGDCDDSDAAYNPGAAETDCTDPNDYNCDGSTGYADDDGDGFAACDDCDDSDAAINADADELCDGVDNDCDGTIDEDDAVDADTWYADADGDGFGDVGSTTTACTRPSGYVSATYATDCDDSDASISPVDPEVCDEVDNDCDGTVDEGVTDTYYADADGDGYGDAGSTTEACGEGSGYVADDNDCDDADAAVNPGEDELCDGLDNDCDGTVDEADATDAATWYRDRDGDGYGSASASTVSCDQPTGYVADATDCDDGDDDIFPGADETCDGVDEDCDGVVDEEAVDADTWYADTDGDGYGDAGSTMDACTQPSGYVADDSDCDDGDAAVSPAATEICNSIDDDCDGWIDDDDPDVTGTSTWYLDFDGDGYGSTAYTADACTQPTGYVADATDCDDADATAYPGADEICDGADNDCDGDVDEDGALGAATWYADADGDGYGDAGDTAVSCEAPTGYVDDDSDCDDADAAINPAAIEDCDGIDNDCDGDTDEGMDSDADGLADCFDTEECDGVDNDGDGLVDDDDPSVTGTSVWYADYDSDGYGGRRLSTRACVQPSGYVADNTDCDDGDASAYPGATEVCDGADNDCDGTVDEADAVDAATWYADADGDGYGDSGSTQLGCDAPSGYVADSTDCDDGDAAVNPAASESCNGVDDDCDGLTDGDDPDVTGTATWYADTDGDGYGDATSAVDACSAPSGYVGDDTDCDDTDASVNPGATEMCNGVDDDCDGLTDGRDPDVVDMDQWWADYDSDGYGGWRLSLWACVQPSGYVDNRDDCDDGDASAYPGADEVCDGVDNDCDGDVDEAGALDEATWYADGDSDGYGDAGASMDACSQPSGYVSDATDCDDGAAAINPGAAELCNGVDDDCDGLTDDDDPDITGSSTWYADTDGDGFGDAGATTISCTQPSGSVADDSDCDDSDAAVNPSAVEMCNTVDDDCDGTVDEDDASDASTWYADNDADGYGDAGSSTNACLQPSGYVSDDTDCDDHDDDVHPYAEETCDGDDEDCDGTVDEEATDMDTWYADADGDGYGDVGSTAEACSMPSGYVADDNDCDDGDASINPAASDDCDGIDNDCDGALDEDASDADTWYIDVDGDGYGSSTYTVSACAQPAGYVADSTDCNDLDSDIHPGATEICDGVDQDCDGSVDEGATDPGTWYLDADGDGYGDVSSTTTGCSAPTGYVADDTDCDDDDASIHPDAVEICDGLDNDCDGVADTGVLGSGELCAADSCLEALIDDPLAADGTYWVYLDGVASEVECDMTTDGGGWTLIFFDDFETSVDPGWSLYSTYACGSFGTLLGGYGIIANGEIDNDLDCYGVPHSEGWVDLEYAALDSWDGETAYVEVDGTTIASWSQNNHSSSYGEVCGWNRGYYGSYDSLHLVDEIFTHSADSMTLVVGSTLNQAATDESFGIEEVWVWVR
jgi:hypothetical protein